MKFKHNCFPHIFILLEFGKKLDLQFIFLDNKRNLRIHYSTFFLILNRELLLGPLLNNYI